MADFVWTKPVIVAAALMLTAALPAFAAGGPATSSGRANTTASGKGGAGGDMDLVGNWPRLSLETIANFEVSGLVATDGPPSRHAQPYLRFDTTGVVDVNDALSFDGLFQFKARAPRPLTDPNRNLFINQGAGRQEGGKFKELYARYETWRVGKFVQNFGRAYVLLPGPFAADFLEEPDEGYEPSEMLGVEKLHVFESEKYGWQQLSVSAFMVDRTFLHRSYPYDEGQIHYRDGGVGNTRLPTNLMVTYDVLNMPVGHGSQLSLQASAIKYGRSFGAERGEIWTTVGGDIAIPLTNSVEKTLAGQYSQLRLYVEAANRSNFKGFANANRAYLTGSAQLMTGLWQVAATTTQRWTTDPILPLRKDEIYTGTVGYQLPTQSLVLLSIAGEKVGDRHGIYAGIRLQQTLTTCSKCFAHGQAF